MSTSLFKLRWKTMQFDTSNDSIFFNRNWSLGICGTGSGESGTGTSPRCERKWWCNASNFVVFDVEFEKIVFLSFSTIYFAFPSKSIFKLKKKNQKYYPIEFKNGAICKKNLTFFISVFIHKSHFLKNHIRFAKKMPYLVPHNIKK